MSSTAGAFLIGYFLIGAIVTAISWRLESLLARHTGKTWAGDPDFQGLFVVFAIWPLYLLIVFFGDSNLEESEYAKKKMLRPPDAWKFSVNPKGNEDVRVCLHKRDVPPLIIGDAPIADDDFDKTLRKLKQKAEARVSTLNALED